MKIVRTITILTALMLLWAVVDHPYSYYQILRWVVCGVGAYSAYHAYENKDNTWAWMFGIVAVLFNPISPIHFQRETWVILDVAASGVFFASLHYFKGKGA